MSRSSPAPKKAGGNYYPINNDLQKITYYSPGEVNIRTGVPPLPYGSNGQLHPAQRTFPSGYQPLHNRPLAPRPIPAPATIPQSPHPLVTVYMDNLSKQVGSQGIAHTALIERVSRTETRLDQVKENADSRVRRLTSYLEKALKRIDDLESRLLEAEKAKKRVDVLEARLVELEEKFDDPNANAAVTHEMATSPTKPGTNRVAPTTTPWLQDSPLTTPTTSPEPEELFGQPGAPGLAGNNKTSPNGGSMSSTSRGYILASTSNGSLNKSPSGKLLFKRPSLAKNTTIGNGFKQPETLAHSRAARMAELELELDNALDGLIGSSPVKPSQQKHTDTMLEIANPIPSHFISSGHGILTPASSSQEVAFGRTVKNTHTDRIHNNLVPEASSTPHVFIHQGSPEAMITDQLQLSSTVLPTPEQTRSPVPFSRLSLTPLSPLSDLNELDQEDDVGLNVNLKRQPPSTEGVKKKKRRIGEGELRYPRNSQLPSSSHNHMRGSSVSSTTSNKKNRLTSDEKNWPNLFSGSEEHDKTLVECDACSSWYHFGCVGMTLDDPRLKESATFFCPPCTTGGPRVLSKSRFRQGTCARPVCRYPVKDKEGFFIEEIVGRKVKAGKILYLIKWEGYPFTKASWEPANAIPDRSYFKRFEDAMLDEQISVKPGQVILLNVARVAGCWEDM